MRLILLTIFFSLAIASIASAQSQVTMYAGNGSIAVRNGTLQDGVFDEYWVEGRQQTFSMNLTLDSSVISGTGSTRLKLWLCDYEKDNASCKEYIIFDTDFDGFPDSSAVTGTFPSGGHKRLVVPRWLRFEVTAQPSGTEKPVLSVAAVK